jgi:hypothetical protein
MEVLQHVGFPNTWVNWLAELLRTAGTHVLLNGEPGRTICHGTAYARAIPYAVHSGDGSPWRHV